MDFFPIEQAALPQCAALFINVFNAPPWNENWEAEVVAARLDECFRTPGFFGVIVKCEGEVVGFAMGIMERWDKGRHFYLKEMCVATKHQNGGIGTALIEDLEERLRKEGVKKITLHTARDTPAQAFYEKREFFISSRMIMMSKWLTPK